MKQTCARARVCTGCICECCVLVWFIILETCVKKKNNNKQGLTLQLTLKLCICACGKAGINISEILHQDCFPNSILHAQSLQFTLFYCHFYNKPNVKSHEDASVSSLWCTVVLLFHTSQKYLILIGQAQHSEGSNGCMMRFGFVFLLKCSLNYMYV